MGMGEEEEDKVVIQAARSAHCKRHENDCIWKISVQSPIMQIYNIERYSMLQRLKKISAETEIKKPPNPL